MTLTSEQRKIINKRNAEQAKGPKTPGGKERSRRNSLKHGLCARVIPLPNENHDIISSRYDSWNEFYRPQNPAQQHLVNQCVHATLLADRCQQFHAAALAQQVRNAQERWDRDRHDWDHDRRDRDWDHDRHDWDHDRY